jgi:hypothetical protein
MAYKIFMGAKPSPKAYIKPFDIAEIRMLPKTSIRICLDIITESKNNFPIFVEDHHV